MALQVAMLPVGPGTSMWVQWSVGTRTHRLLGDGGVWHTYRAVWERVRELPRSKRRFELVVCSHIDGDHIDGLIRLLHDRDALGLRIGTFWFNGWRHLGGPQVLGVAQGEYLGALLDSIAPEVGWNGTPLVVEPGAPLPTCDLPGDVLVTVVSPFRPQLERLRTDWRKEVGDAEPGDSRRARERFQTASRLRRYAGLGAGQVLGGDDAAPDALPAARDSTVTNASSIAVLVERAGSSVLLTGDAAPEVLRAGIARLLSDRGLDHLHVDALVVPHHGSNEHTTPELLEIVSADRYLFSSDGSLYDHPGAKAVEAVLDAEAARGSTPELVFNYRTEFTAGWLDRTLRPDVGYTAVLAAGTATEV